MPAATDQRAPARRTQAERSAATRGLLLDATVASLVELGFAHTSTVEVARRAGVSRGAQLHHFPTKTELVVAAVEHVFARRVDEFVGALAERPADPGADVFHTAIDLLWSLFQGDTHVAWLELVVAARTDAELAPHVARLTDHVVERVGEVWAELCGPLAHDPDHADALAMAPTFILTVLNGLGVARLCGSRYAELEERIVLDLVKRFAADHLPPLARLPGTARPPA